jgi:hypothetical protein
VKEIYHAFWQALVSSFLEASHQKHNCTNNEVIHLDGSILFTHISIKDLQWQ